MTIEQLIALLEKELTYQKLVAKGLVDPKLKEHAKGKVEGLMTSLKIIKEGKRE